MTGEIGIEVVESQHNVIDFAAAPGRQQPRDNATVGDRFQHQAAAAVRVHASTGRVPACAPPAMIPYMRIY